ncbi:hypothetical protein MXMO3_00677 [Maritalea myrionectae]|uniref:Uncharacterized protein n=1 Tax=Maritalea myrionectae TaxID=454601 RepID=A0A2R4MB29_9HYPH|nr:hypothetical protein [Maritalea myrionectae]AVX03210.1 hypothetical protein MXMO3_00677 [Maritalea myrionectae]
MGHLTIYLRSCIWLWVPPLLASFAFWPHLGVAYQPEEFWRDIPVLLGMVENVTRICIIAFSTIMVINWCTRPQRIGFLIYAVGIALYVACQWIIVSAPTGWWATSLIGFLAPSYTPLIWIFGIGLIGDQSMIPQLARPRLYFWVLAGIFLSAHIAHASLVFSRLY